MKLFCRIDLHDYICRTNQNGTILKMYFLGFDIGSSSVKVALLDGEKGTCISSSFFPKQEMKMIAHQSGWAEQEPEQWWSCLKEALAEVLATTNIDKSKIEAIGISHQMHGLVCVDKENKPIRPAIIWCDSRATAIGDKALAELGEQNCLSNFLNSPGNFTASKLKWVKENEPELYHRIAKIMLPGDYIAMKLSGEIQSTIGNLSEGVFWNFKENDVAQSLLDYYGIEKKLLPSLVSTFSVQAKLLDSVADELNLPKGVKLSYRAGDQPNNAFSLNVLKPGEVAATAGTSGVVYGVSGDIKYDEHSRVNTFAHVNHCANLPRLGVLLCINGTGIQNSWLKSNLIGNNASYEQINTMANSAPIGSGGISVLPFGNGAERVLGNKQLSSVISGIDFNQHSTAHICRAVQEGIVFSFQYGMEIMAQLGIDAKVIRAGHANMFLSPLFRETLAGVSGATIELYNTDGAIGAARGAALGSGYYANEDEAFVGLNKIEQIEPNNNNKEAYTEAYEKWKTVLNNNLK